MKALWWWVLAGCVLAAVLFGLWVFPAGDKDIQGATSVTASVPGMKGVSVTLGTNKRIVQKGETLDFSMRIDNATDATTGPVAIVSTLEPGFQYQALVFDQTIVAGRGSLQSHPLALTPYADQGVFLLSVSYAIKDSAGNSHRGEISSGKIELKDPDKLRWQVFGRRAVSLFKDLTLPLVVAFLGFWFQSQQARRDEESRNKASEESRREEIWKTILPNFYLLSEKHYQPIVRSLRLVEKHSQVDQGGAIPSVERLCFEFVFLLFRMDLLRQTHGQIFFKSRNGERLVSGAWLALIQGSELALERGCIDAAMREMTTKTVYQDFMVQPRSMAWSQILQKFKLWVGLKDPKKNFASYLGLIAILKIVFRFEANQPFDRDWYGEPPEFEMLDGDRYIYPEEDVCKDAVAKVREQVTPYREGVLAYLRSFRKDA